MRLPLAAVAALFCVGAILVAYKPPDTTALRRRSAATSERNLQHHSEIKTLAQGTVRAPFRADGDEDSDEDTAGHGARPVEVDLFRTAPHIQSSFLQLQNNLSRLVSTASQLTASMTFADLDNDGDLDILVANGQLNASTQSISDPLFL